MVGENEYSGKQRHFNCGIDRILAKEKEKNVVGECLSKHCKKTNDFNNFISYLVCKTEVDNQTRKF